MKQNGYKILTVVLVISLTAISCALPFNLMAEPTSIPSTETPTPEVVHEIQAGFTGDPEVPFVVVHRSGENLALLQDPAVSKPRGAIWTSADGQSLTIYSDEQGRPDVVMVGEDVIFYSNYTADTVDMTVINQQGEQVTVTAPLDVQTLQKITAARTTDYDLISFSRPALYGEEPLDQYFWMQTGLYMLNVATCTAGVLATVSGGPAAVGMFQFLLPATLPLLAKSCVGALLSTIIKVGKIAGMDVSYWEDINQKFSAVSCVIDLNILGGKADANLLKMKDAKSLSSCLGILVGAAKELDKLVRVSVNKKPQYAGLQLGTFEFDKLPTVTPTATATPTPTATPVATATLVPLTSLRGVVNERSACRYGPGAPYLYMYGLQPGVRMEAIGRDADGDWLKIRAIGGDNPCWLKASLINLDDDVMRLPDAYMEPLVRPISPFFEAITLLGVSSGGTVSVSWQNHDIRADLDTEQGIEYLIEVWTCKDGKPVFYALGFAPGVTSGSFTVDYNCGVPSRAVIRGMDKEGFSRWTNIPLH